MICVNMRVNVLVQCVRMYMLGVNTLGNMKTIPCDESKLSSLQGLTSGKVKPLATCLHCVQLQGETRNLIKFLNSDTDALADRASTFRTDQHTRAYQVFNRQTHLKRR